MQCIVCGKEINLQSADNTSGETAFGAREVDPSQGTRQFHDGQWIYFDSLNCRTKFMMNPKKYLSPSS